MATKTNGIYQLKIKGVDYDLIDYDAQQKIASAEQDINDIKDKLEQIIGGVAFVGTRAEYEQAKLIPEGQTGHIPSGTLVCITDENTYLMGEQKTINRRKGVENENF